MTQGMTLREFGRFLNVSCEAVRKAIKSGRIPKEAMGEITLQPSGKVRPVIIDPVLAKRGWEQNTDAVWHRPKELMQQAGRKSAAVKKGQEFKEAPITEPASEVAAGPTKTGNGPSINESNRITAAYKARMAKIEYEQAVGKLVNAEQIKLMFSQQIAEAKNKFMGVGRNARARIPHLTIEDVEVIEKLCSEALEDLANGSI
jgi:phage terminase Nu1 subunit (DNA packaging protein)